MRTLARLIGWLVLGLAGLLVLVWVFGQREPVDLTGGADREAIAADPVGYLAAAEAAYDDITPGVEKSILWAGETGAATDLALIYVHGFSATAQEIRPVSERVAEELGANLVFTRLTGHGRGGDAMAEATVADWARDFDEALAVAEAVGERIVVISTSTGGTLTAAMLAEGRDVAGAVMLSPNFRIGNPASAILTWPAARYWLPRITGAERGFEAASEDHERYWTTRYPTTALFPMAALVAHVRDADLAGVETPLLVLFSPDDQVVDPVATRTTAARWGGPVTLSEQAVGAGDDPQAHLIAGDIMSPGRTEAVVAEIVVWLRGL